jgi:hypothetical protein
MDEKGIVSYRRARVTRVMEASKQVVVALVHGEETCLALDRVVADDAPEHEEVGFPSGPRLGL